MSTTTLSTQLVEPYAHQRHGLVPECCSSGPQDSEKEGKLMQKEGGELGLTRAIGYAEETCDTTLT